MNKFRTFAVIILLAFLSCSHDESKQITINWWQFWTDAGIKPLIQQMVQEFEALHPEVKVNLVDLTWADGHDKISIAFSSGSGPDVVELGSDWIAEFAFTGHLDDITKSTDSLRDGYFMWEPATVSSKVYAFPWVLGTRVLFINRQLLAQAGYDSTFVPQSWEELLLVAKKINNPSEGVFGFGSNSAERHRLYKKFLPFLWANGGDILSPDETKCILDSPQAIAALEYYLQLCQAGLTDTQRRLEDAFLDGRIGFVISGDWLLKRLNNEKPGFAFSTCLIPGPTGLTSSSSFAGGEYLSVSQSSKHKDIAFQFIHFICSPENQLRFCMQNQSANPSSKKAAADSAFLAQSHFGTFITQMSMAKTPPNHPRWVYIEDQLEKGIETALYGTKTPPQALSETSQAIEELLKK